MAVRSPWVTIIGLMTNGATPVTCGTPWTFFITSRYSRKSIEYLSTRTCALTPRTFSRNCSWKPPVTLMTMVRAATPSRTPPTARAVLMETMFRFLEAR